MKLIQSATSKLTLWYLGIILVVTSIFSTALYRESVDQLAENFDHQRSAITRLPLPVQYEARRNQFLDNLDSQFDADRQRILLRLVALNLATLLLGGAAAYWLARRTLRPIQDSMEAQGRFTADASHELRTPLTAMRTEIEVALREKTLTSSDARGLLTSNLEEIAKLEALSAGLLRLARFEGGLDVEAVSDVPVRELFEEAAGRFQVLLSQRGIVLDIKAGPERVAGDRDSLIEMVAIFLDNAIKYSPDKSKIILRSDATNSLVRLGIIDQGIGINHSDMPHLFERFYRADRSRTGGQTKGYGLGLSIAKRITDLHHGAITVESAPGKGATFRIKLPIHYTPKKTLF